MLGKIEGTRKRGQQRMRWLDGLTNSMDEFEQTPGDSEGQGSLVCCNPWGDRVAHDLATEQQQQQQATTREKTFPKQRICI